MIEWDNLHKKPGPKLVHFRKDEVKSFDAQGVIIEENRTNNLSHNHFDNAVWTKNKGS